MEITIIAKMAAIVLAVSLSSERLVTFLKTLFPGLASKTNNQANATPPAVEGSEKVRQIMVMIIAFLSAWLTASFLIDGKFKPFASYDIGPPQTLIPVWIIGLLASGGSAFWTNLLGYVQSVKNLNTQKFQNEKLNGATQFASLQEKQQTN